MSRVVINLNELGALVLMIFINLILFQKSDHHDKKRLTAPMIDPD